MVRNKYKLSVFYLFVYEVVLGRPKLYLHLADTHQYYIIDITSQ